MQAPSQIFFDEPLTFHTSRGIYCTENILKSNSGSVTYIGRHTQTQERVIIKSADSKADSATYTRLIRQASLLQTRHAPNLPEVIHFEERFGKAFLITPFVQGIPLNEIIKKKSLSALETIQIAKSLTSILKEAHAEGILHRDIKPQNVIVPQSGMYDQARLIDFGFAKSFDPELAFSEELLGTLLYISPEQAGLIEASVDDKSDLYSLGMLLSECLLGAPPFDAKNLSDILRKQLYERPALYSLNPKPPEPVLDLINHLIEKDPKDRYQSTDGLLFDLIEIEKLIKKDAERSFTVGLQDKRSSLTYPSFIGRRTELQELSRALDTIRLGPSHVYSVEAESGGGKTKLLQEFSRKCQTSDIRILWGQGRDQVANVPFQVFLETFRGISLLCSKDKDLSERLRISLSDYAGTLVEIFPGFKEIFEPLKPAQKNSGPEAFGEARSMQALFQLFSTLGIAGHPIVFLLDDFQWADELSSKFLKLWFSETARKKISSFSLIIVAFRSEEVDTFHNLRQMQWTRQLKLSALNQTETKELLVSMAGILPSKVCDLIYDTAKGNPFMASALLRGLVESKNLVYQGNEWKMFEIDENIEPSKQAAAILKLRLRNLRDETISILKVASVAGKAFNLNLLSAATDLPRLAIIEGLEQALRRQIISEKPNGDFHFFHDKIREYLLSLLSDAEKTKIHLNMAEFYQTYKSQHPFEISYHFDAAGLSDKALPFALRSAADAREKSSLKVAEEEYQIAVRGIKKHGSFIQAYVFFNLLQVQMLRGRYQEASLTLDEIFKLSLNKPNTAHLWSLKGELSFKQGKTEDAAYALEKALTVLGIKIYSSFVLPLIWEVFIQTLHSCLPRWLYRRRRVMNSNEKLAARILSRITYTYWFTRGRLACAWSHFKEMNLCERFSDSLDLAQAYSEHGPVLTMVPWFKRAQAYVEKSLAIRQKFSDFWGQGQSKHFLGVVKYGSSQFEETIEACEEASSILRKTGDQWEANTASWHAAYAHYRLGRLKEAVTLARQVYDGALRIGDYQSSVISVSIWAKAAQGDLPFSCIERALSDSQDIHTRAESLQAHGICLMKLNRFSEAMQVLKSGILLVEKAGFRQEYIVPLYAWYATAIRLSFENENLYKIQARHEELNEWKSAVDKTVAISHYYQNNLPHSLREKALYLGYKGKMQAAFKYLNQSLSVAKRQGAAHEVELTYKAGIQLKSVQNLEISEFEIPQEINNSTSSKNNSSHNYLENNDIRKASPAIYHQLKSIQAMGSKLLTCMDRQELLLSSVDLVASLFNADRCAIVEIHGDGDNFQYETLKTYSELNSEVSQTLVREVLVRKQAFTFDDLQIHDFSESFAVQGVRSVLGIPILVDEKNTYAIFAFNDRISTAYGPEEQELSTFVAHLITAALENLNNFRELQESRSRLQKIIDAAPNAIILTDVLGKIVLVNQQMEKLFLYSRDDLLGQPVEMLMPERYRQQHPQYRSMFLNNLKARPMGQGRDLFALRKNGTEFPVEIGLTPLFTSDGNFVISSIVDISERKKFESELIRQRDKLQESNEDLERFAYVASHDLREPLRAIRSWSEILQDNLGDTLSPDSQKAFGFIKRGADRMSSLVQALLEYSKASRGKFDLKDVNLREPLDLARSNLLKAIEDSHCKIEIEGDFPTLTVAPFSIAQVFQNLIGNAIKYRCKENCQIKISCRQSDADKTWVFCVEDNGIGIEPKHIDRIFEVFKRLHTQEEYEGNGIGLSITKKVIEKHGGKIWVESEPKKGSKFFFSLPNLVQTKD